MKKYHKSPLAIAMGASLLPFVAPMAHAESNPFAVSELQSGYLQTAEAAPAKPDDSAAKMKDGACGEGKCGAAMTKSAPAVDKKAIEGKCAGNKPAAPADSGKK